MSKSRKRDVWSHHLNPEMHCTVVEREVLHFLKMFAQNIESYRKTISFVFAARPDTPDSKYWSK